MGDETASLFFQPHAVTCWYNTALVLMGRRGQLRCHLLSWCQMRGEETLGTWWECGAPIPSLGLPTLGLTHSRDLEHDREEPLKLEVVLAPCWEGLLCTALGGTLLSPWAPTGPGWRTVRRQKNWGLEKWCCDFPKRVAFPLNQGQQTLAVVMSSQHRLRPSHFWIQVLRHTLWESERQRLIISSQPAVLTLLKVYFTWLRLLTI